MKEHSLVIRCEFQGDGDTIAYDPTHPGGGVAACKAFKLVDGIGMLVADGDAIDGKVLEVKPNHVFVGAFQFEGLLLPLGPAESVRVGDRIVGALGYEDAPGYVRAADAAATVPEDMALLTTKLDIDTDAKRLAAINANREQINAIFAILRSVLGNNGRGLVLDFDDTHLLAAFGNW